MQDCCQIQYDRTFDAKYAQDSRDIMRSGDLKKGTQPLLEGLRYLDLAERSVLEIGGGVGALIFKLFEAGTSYATNVDISRACCEAFNSEARRRGFSAMTEAVQGDFVGLHANIESADLVVLDKVICCYRNFQDLVKLSCSKANKWYAFSMPRDVWWVHLADFVDNRWRTLKGRRFPTFVHPVAEVFNILDSNGFRQIHESRQREWLIAIFERQ